METTKQSSLNKEPYALEIERAVLGAILFDTDNYKEAGYILFPELFYDRSHQVIYSSMQKFIEYGKGMEVNATSLKEHLLKDGQLEACGGEVYLKQLEELAQLPLNIEIDAKTLYAKYLFRECLSVYDELILKFDDGYDIIKHIENTERKIHEIIHNLPNLEMPALLSSSTSNYVNLLQDRYIKGTVQELSTGYENIDEITNGLQRGALIVVGARPSMGKTAWLINLANNVSTHAGTPKITGLFSMGMRKDILEMRFISLESQVNMKRICSAQLMPNDIRKIATSTLSFAESASIYLDDVGCKSILELKLKCQFLKRCNKHLDLVLVDDLHLIGSCVDGESYAKESAEIMSSLKLLAKDLDVPVIVTLPLNEVLGKRPVLSDFRGADAIEKYADVVMAIDRGHVSHKIISNKGITELIFVMNRNGPLGTAKLTFLSSYARFEDPPEDPRSGRPMNMQ